MKKYGYKFIEIPLVTDETERPGCVQTQQPPVSAPRLFRFEQPEG